MFQFEFHWYGFFVGLALVIGFSLVEYHAKKKDIPAEFIGPVAVWMFIGGLIGARAWHVMTDFHLYKSNLPNVLAIWQGGLSIIGCMIGAFIAFWLFFYFHPQWKKNRLVLLDITVFGLPIAQAIGRIGNFVNQELYGFPTNLIIGIKIDDSNRIDGFEQFLYFHPLFAYEAIPLLFFAAFIWWKRESVVIGNGTLFLFYIAFYSWLRFILDFLRIDKAASFIGGVGFNQVVLFLVGFTVSTYLVFDLLKKKYLFLGASKHAS